MNKVIIAGGRDFTNIRYLTGACDGVITNYAGPDVEIVSGGAQGTDRLGEAFASLHDYRLRVFHADWKRYNKAAGPIRNRQMAEYADILIAFWDGKSGGTKNMIDEAEKLGLSVFVFHYAPDGTPVHYNGVI